ncbi:unnamed protein product [Ambrosiozyma monospora]|uniref:Unnamed protein product n=1 Tax=Ambrosiozyma monospora TaxID=43982 RepID=A0A9W6Z4V1_AMBMO|nr:unnamed protein product [Ambrosiozyma monospora]
MIGLRSSNAYEPSLKLLDRLNLLKGSEIIGSGDSRLLFALLANMPRFLHAQTNKRFPEEVVNAANMISSMAEAADIPGLSRIVTSLVKKRFRNKEDFMAQIVSILKNHFFPTYAAKTLVFLLGLLFNKITWIKVEVMDLLKHVFKVVDLSSEDFQGLGADLVSPLLRLLLTEFVDDALEVLDEAKSISPSPFDKHYLMMSAGDSSIRKEYEKIATLFGIPDDSGWSIPMPAVNTARTRNNIHSVFSTCTISQNEGDSNVPIEEPLPQFNRDDYVQYNPLPQAQEQQIIYQRQQQHTILQPQQQDDVDSLSNMLATLENLDSFFTKDSMELPQTYGHQYSGSVDTKSTIATNATTDQSNWNMNFDSPGIEAIPQFSTSTSFKTLLGDDSQQDLSSHPTTVGSTFKNYRRRKSFHGTINTGLENSAAAELSATLGSPILANSTSPLGEQDEGLFRSDMLRGKKRPKQGLSSPLATSSPISYGSKTPRTPRGTPRSPYARNSYSRFSRNSFGGPYAKRNIYSPNRDAHEENNVNHKSPE